MLESVGKTWLRSLLHNIDFLYQQIESEASGLGIPDAFLRTSRNSYWIEFKRLTVQGQKTIRIPFRPLQFSWLKDHYRLGGESVLIAFYENHLDGKCIAIFRNEAIRKEYSPPDFVALASSVGSLKTFTLINFLDALSDH